MVAGAAISAYSQHQQAESEAEVARNNAKLAGMQRSDALRRGTWAASEVMAEGRRKTASARTAIAANGIDSTTGSMADLLTASSINARIDADTVRANAVRAAWGFGNEADDHLARAHMAKRSGYLGALGTGLSGVGSAAGHYGSRGVKA
jgi:hypothetical protein